MHVGGRKVLQINFGSSEAVGWAGVYLGKLADVAELHVVQNVITGIHSAYPRKAGHVPQPITCLLKNTLNRSPHSNIIPLLVYYFFFFNLGFTFRVTSACSLSTQNASNSQTTISMQY